MPSFFFISPYREFWFPPIIFTFSILPFISLSDLTITDSVNKNYSKGILKKVHIARSISKNSQVYIFDDPLLYLDKLGKNMVIKLLASVKRAGKTVICFSEDTEIIKLSDKQISLG